MKPSLSETLLYFLINFLRCRLVTQAGLAVYLTMILNFWPFCCYLWSAEITGMDDHVQLFLFFLILKSQNIPHCIS